MANDDSIDKRTPLISKVSAGSGALGNPNGSGSFMVTIPPIYQDQLPPPYEPIEQPAVPCRVCQAKINVKGIKGHVVSCGACSEATPIGNAPIGKKYVRCPCNCLLICDTSTMMIACPRGNCKRVSNTCRHCLQTFVFDRQTQALARCPHCHKMGPGPGLASKLGTWIYFSLLLCYVLFFILGIGVGVVVTICLYERAKRNNGYYFLWTGAYVLAVGGLIRGLHYARMKVGFRSDSGRIQTPSNNENKSREMEEGVWTKTPPQLPATTFKN